jgi:hypothetical protein
MSVPIIRKSLQSPFEIDKKEIKQLSEVKKGDIVLLKHIKAAEHAVIVTEVHVRNDDPLKGVIQGVHYKKQSLFGNHKVMEEYFPMNLNQSAIKIFDCKRLLTYSPEETVILARLRIGETKWKLTSNNDKHLCFWAKVRTRPRRDYESFHNMDRDVLRIHQLSSLYLGEKDVHLEKDLYLGDVIKYKQLGILVGNVSLDGGLGRRFQIEMMVYNWWYHCIKKTYIVDLNKDSIIIKRYHPSHCYPMTIRVTRAKQLENKRCVWWTNRGFIEHVLKRVKIK